MNTYKGFITKLEPNDIFIYGSNLQGNHNSGAALWALYNAGAVYGIGEGLVNQSYGIVTVDLLVGVRPSVPMEAIMRDIKIMYLQANVLRDKRWLVGYSGKGPYLSGYNPAQMSGMFANADDGHIPPNIWFEEGFSELVKAHLLIIEKLREDI